MKRKQQFLNAVQLLAPNDEFILNAAQRIREEMLPEIPGGAALEFVAAMAKLRDRLPTPLRPRRKADRKQDCEPKPWLVVASSSEKDAATANPVAHPISVPHALRIQRAETWLNQGQPVKALEQLDKLPARAKRHPWATRVLASAVSGVRDMNEMTVQE